MSFKRGQVVRITRIDPGDDSAWLGFLATVADTFVGETSSRLVDGGSNTKLIPLSKRPDTRYPHIEPYGFFFWPTADLELVSEPVDVD